MITVIALKSGSSQGFNSSAGIYLPHASVGGVSDVDVPRLINAHALRHEQLCRCGRTAIAAESKVSVPGYSLDCAAGVDHPDAIVDVVGDVYAPAKMPVI